MGRQIAAEYETFDKRLGRLQLKMNKIDNNYFPSIKARIYVA